MTVLIYKNGIHHINLVTIQDMKYLFKKVNEKVQKKNDFIVGVGKINIKHIFSFQMLAQFQGSYAAIGT